MNDPIIITGFQRSGTTAVAYALHKIFCNIINESGIMKTALGEMISMTDRLGEHIQWRFDEPDLFMDTDISDYIKKLYMKLLDSEAHSVHFTKDYKDDMKTSIIDHALREPAHYDYWGDKITNAAHMVPVIKEIFPDAKIIYVLREPLEAIASNLRLGWINSLGNAWSMWMTEFIEYRQWMHSIPHLIVRQKELLESPQKVASDMSKFLDFQFLGRDFGAFVYKGNKPDRVTTNPADYFVSVPNEMMELVELARGL